MKQGKEWFSTLRRQLAASRRLLRRAELGLYAANGSYYFFLSLGPLTALMLALMPCTPLTEGELMETLLRFAPAPTRQLVRSVVTDVYAGSGAVLGLSLVLELWSGARFLAAVTYALRAVAGGQEGGFLRRRLMGAAYTAALIGFVLGNLMLQLFGSRLLLAAERVCPELTGLWAVFLRLRPLLFFLGLTSGNVLLFSRTAGRGLRGQVPGGALAAAGWLLFSRAFSWGLERFGLFGVYGSIAAAAASLCWMYGLLYILFLGAWVNGLLRKRAGEGE